MTRPEALTRGLGAWACVPTTMPHGPGGDAGSRAQQEVFPGRIARCPQRAVSPTPHGTAAGATTVYAGRLQALPARVGWPTGGPGGPSVGRRTGHLVACGAAIGCHVVCRRFAERTVLRRRPWPPRLVVDVQVLVAHAARVATRAHHLGNPARLIRAPDVWALFYLPVGCHPGGPTDDAGTQGRARS